MRTAAVILTVLTAALGPGTGDVGAFLDAPTRGRQAPATPDSCARCHRQIADEWRVSAHALAHTDPIYRRSLTTTREPERCVGCHAPQPVHGRLGRRPSPRDTDRDHGVDCAACHALGQRIAGPFGADTDAHESTRHPSFSLSGSVSLCASCHDTSIGPVHALARDFLAAGLAERGKSCVGCHMERTVRPIANDPDDGTATGPARDGRSHALLGPDDPEFCASAFKIAVQPLDEAIEVAVGNRAGHRVPGLDFRRFVIALRQLDAEGRAVAEDRIELSTENPLYVLETRRFRFALSPSAVGAETVLTHEFTDRDSTELSREEHSW